MQETDERAQTARTVNAPDDGAATIELNRPDAERVEQAVRRGPARGAARAGEDEAVRAVRITGAGRAFSSGADLKDISGDDLTPEGRPNVYRVLTERYHPIMHAIREMQKPVVAAVNGPAVGIGCSLALCCDLIVAAESAYFLLAFVNIGLVARRRLLAVRARPRRHGARGRDGDARRARARRRRRSNGASSTRRRRRGLLARERRAGRTPGGGADPRLCGHQARAQQLAVLAHGRAARAGGARCSRRWPGARTSWRASSAFLGKRPADFSGR